MLFTVELAGFIWVLFEVVLGVLIGLNSSQLPLAGASGPGPDIEIEDKTGVVGIVELSTF